MHFLAPTMDENNSPCLIISSFTARMDFCRFLYTAWRKKTPLWHSSPCR